MDRICVKLNKRAAFLPDGLGCITSFISLINNLVVNHNSSVPELTFKYFLEKYPNFVPLFALFPHLAPQQVKTNSSSMCTDCLTQIYCRVNM